jgi:hypothetical protein
VTGTQVLGGNLKKINEFAFKAFQLKLALVYA